MISYERTLVWTLCWALAATVASAEEPEAAAAAPAEAEAGSAASMEEAREPLAAADMASDASDDAMDVDSLDGGVDPMAGAVLDADPMMGSMEADPMAAMADGADPDAAPSELGAVAWDSEGREGRIHVVATGDTLWEISNAYLGTPWVWPSIWNDNGEIANPHVIHPGDRIWITASEMRRLTPEEADAMLANGPPVPAAMDEFPAAMEDAVPGMEEMLPPVPGRTVRVSSRETTGLISPEVYESAASVVARGEDRVMLSQEDDLFIGLGEAEVQPGDEFTVFRSDQKVIDPDTSSVLGYHVDILGWVRVEETFAETSRASVRMTTGGVEVGDRVMPREAMPEEVEVKPRPDGVEGKITFFPMRRVLLGYADFVYLNRGTLDGLEVGSPLEVYRVGGPAFEAARDEKVEVPETVIGKMLVVRAEEQTAVALVTKADKELQLGDLFRGDGEQ